MLLCGRSFWHTPVMLSVAILLSSCSPQTDSSLNELHPSGPECVYVPDEPEMPPTDPFEMDEDCDGMTVQQRVTLIRKGVAATIKIRTRRYSKNKGYTFHVGTGVFISDSLALTAEHVIADTVDRYAILRRIVGKSLRIGYLRQERITILNSNEELDVALVRVHCPNEMSYPLPIERAWNPEKGELLWQFGQNTGWSRGRVVRQIPEEIPVKVRGMVQMRMLGQGGDSGGPVVNINGELVGLILRGSPEHGRQFFLPIDTALNAVGL